MVRPACERGSMAQMVVIDCRDSAAHKSWREALVGVALELAPLSST